MTDFNPASRNDGDFRLPIKPKTRLAEITSRLISILSAPIKIRGADLSHHNEVDFLALKNSGIEFVILKATEHVSWVDEKFDEYWRSAHEVGLPIMTYHFFRSNYGGAPQATHHRNTLRDSGFLETVGYKSPVIWFDVETSDGATVSQRRNRLFAAHQTVEAYGYQSGHYSSPYLWGKLIGDVPWASNYYGWDAHWTPASEPILPLGWTKSSMKVWQYGIHPTHTWVEPVKGVSGAVDCNWYYGTLQELKEWLGIMPPTVDCCEEVFALVAQLEEEISSVKERQDAFYTWNAAQEESLDFLELNDANKEARLLKIEGLIQFAKDLFCKD